MGVARDTVQCHAQQRALARAGTYVTPTLVLEMKDSSTLRSSAIKTLDSLSQGYCSGTVASIEKAPRESRERVFAQRLTDGGAAGGDDGCGAGGGRWFDAATLVRLRVP